MIAIGLLAFVVACGGDDSADATEAASTATEAAPTGTPTLAPSAESVEIAAVKDSTLYEHPDGALSNGSGEYLFAGATNGPKLRRTLIAFDVAAAVPQGATITAVRLTLVLSKGSTSDAEPISLHRALAGWGEGPSDAPGNEGGGAESVAGDATWLHRVFDGERWQNEGGDFAAEASASVMVAGIDLAAGFGLYTWGSTEALVADVQAWLDDPANDFGWMIGGVEEGQRTAKRFNSRENE